MDLLLAAAFARLHKRSIAPGLLASGIFDAALVYQRLRGVKDRICAPSGLITDQVGAVACKYIAEHPESRQMVAVESILEAAAEAWPCE